ncbi:MAG: tetratricopeptide repeat protein [Saprospiraceae bacterium]
MKRNTFLAILLLGIFFWVSCTPKVQEPIVTTEPKEEVVKELDPNGCITWNEIGAAKADRVTDNYNIYRDRIKSKNFKAAYPLWKNVYKTSPKANGRIDYVFRDGLKIYTDFIENTTDTILQAKYVDTMAMIYEKALICFPEKKSYYLSKQGFEYYYKYKGRVADEEIYTMLKTAVEVDGNESRVSTIIPLSSLNYRLFSDEKINSESARKVLENVNSIVSHNVANTENKEEKEAWIQVEQFTSELSDRYENQKGFYNCDYFITKYYSEYETSPENCEVIEDLYRKLKRSGCEAENPKLIALADAYRSKCRTVNPDLLCGKEALENDQFSKAIECYERYVESSDNPEQKANFLLRIAKIHYAHTRQFSKARAAALEAMKYKSNWGEPLILIGKLYASSGPLCGSGTGFNSQVVTWPAIDKWNEAKRVDSSVAAEANGLIGRYAKYMPSKADIFSRPDVKEGGNFTVKCWIQETTKVRAAQ